MPTLALNFSRPSAQFLLRCCNFLRLGRDGGRFDGAVRVALRRVDDAARDADANPRSSMGSARPLQLVAGRCVAGSPYPMLADLQDMTVMRVVFHNGVSLDLTS